MIIHFTKMHGLGNDFIVIDAINQDISLTSKEIQFLADRHYGIGCDQLLLVEKPVSSNADFKYRIFNADGYEVDQCGNGARCFAQFIQDNSRFFLEKQLFNKKEIIVDTHSGQLVLVFKDNTHIKVNMGIPRHKPSEIPITATQEQLNYHLTIDQEKIAFGAVSIGNPHAVIQVDNVENYPVEQMGRSLENHHFFPERANIGFMQIINKTYSKLRVYERGVGETLSCGSGACAAAVVAIQQGLLSKDEDITIEFRDQGCLFINWVGRGQPVFMSGPSTSVFEGTINLLPNIIDKVSVIND